ncbi:MAG TPA: site-specific DNA-methyltransferase [Firmicutes bacterium]|nr:site-specific DNA-methyltransferase [Bacillota bacterium]
MDPSGILDIDLDFHTEGSTYASHALHAFAAKFPPQIPRLFIERFTTKGETVLDPMVGSGTTLLEAYLLGRRAIGVDIDPLAVRMAQVKTTPLKEKVEDIGFNVVFQARFLLGSATVEHELESRFDEEARRFIDYWFLPQTQRELMALICAIEQFPEDSPQRLFLEVVFSSIIITKSGGVSIARDLAHTRPHRDLSKKPKNAIDQFWERIRKIAVPFNTLPNSRPLPEVRLGDARHLDVPDNSVHLVVTSPPYANAIDYMRAHKFSLVWLGKSLSTLSALRGQYVGGEKTTGVALEALPEPVSDIVAQVETKDARKARVLNRYFCDMKLCIGEIHRVLEPGRIAALVVGSSTIRGINVETAKCLGEIGKAVGFSLIGIATRKLDRDRRMMPARAGNGALSNIEQRIHTEEVVIFQKTRSDAN